jgi:hypothetical protein
LPDNLFPSLPGDFETTRATLHAYAHAVGALPRVHAVPHPKWWHISLKPKPNGLITDTMALPSGVTFQLRMDLRNHVIVLETSTGHEEAFSMTQGLTGTQMGDAFIVAVSALGLDGEYSREKFENDDPREYDPAAAETFFAAVSAIDFVMQRHRSALEGDVGPIQLWPHGFDLAFEWFGSRVETYEEHGEIETYPSQLNLGLYPGGRPYFYSNPWPFEEEQLTSHPLPSGAEWHTEGWQGSILHYDQIAGKPDADELLLAFAKAVHAVAAPTLTA